MTPHIITPERKNLHGKFSRDLKPVLTIQSGETVRFSTLDAGWGTEQHREDGTQRDRFEPRDPVLDAGHCLCGPVFIEGAEPGMTLAVKIEKLVPGTWGWTVAGGWHSPPNDRLNVSELPELVHRWTLDPETMIGRNQYGHEVTLSPFLGVMGMPRNVEGLQDTPPPRVTGGNMDCKELVEGVTLFLPIEVPGGLFSTGDGHAKQGDGEVSTTAIECPMSLADLTFILHPEMKIGTPRAITPTGWITLAFDENLHEAMYLALEAMLDWMPEIYEISRQEALALASITVDLRVTQIVNGVSGVHAVLPKDALRNVPFRASK